MGGEATGLSQQRAQVDAELEMLRARRDGARDRLRQRVRTLYRLRRAGALPLAGGIESLLRHQSRLARLSRMVRRDVRSLSSMDRRVTALSSESTRLADAVAAAERRVSEIEATGDERLRNLDVLSEMIRDPSAYAGTNPAGFGIRMADGSATNGFESLRGQLSLPVGGAARVTDATREGGRGLELAAQPGVSVRTVAGGRVAYAARHPAYRQLVIVDHGDSWFTVYGGLATISVSAAQPVGPDAVVGAVGVDPIFFQVRRGSRPLSARAWLGI